MKLKVVSLFVSEKIECAIDLFNERTPIILDGLYELEEKSYFTYSDDTNKQVVRTINQYLSQDKIVYIHGYRSRWPWSSAIGYTSKGRYFINTRKLDSLTADQYAGNIAHEILGHLAGYKHGSNRVTEKKKNSVPYIIGYLISGDFGFAKLLELARKYKGVS